MTKTTTLSTKGQVVIPQEVRDRHGWSAGTQFWVEERGELVVLREVPTAPESTLDELAGSAGYTGPRKNLDEMDRSRAHGLLDQIETSRPEARPGAPSAAELIRQDREER